MAKYIKKPIVIEAFQYGVDEFPNWFLSSHQVKIYANAVDINTLEGVMTATKGDYIIKGIHGELYPCKEDIFKESYEEVDDE